MAYPQDDDDLGKTPRDPGEFGASDDGGIPQRQLRSSGESDWYNRTAGSDERQPFESVDKDSDEPPRGGSDSGALKDREANATNSPLGDTGGGDERDSLYHPDQKGKIRGGKVANWKKRGIIGGIIASVVGGGVGLISFLIPFKADYIHSIIDLKFNSRVEATIENRAEVGMASYLSQTLRNVNTCGSNITITSTSTCSVAYKGILRSWFNNMRDAKIEAKLKTYGIEVNYDRRSNKGAISVWRNGSLQEVEFGGRFTLSGALADAVGEATSDLSHLDRSWVRLSGRSWAARKLGVSKYCFWGPLCKPLDKATSGSRTVKVRFKLKMIEKVVAPVSNRLGLYMTCIVQGCGTGADFDVEFENLRKSLPRMTDTAAREFAEQVLKDTAGGQTFKQVVLNKLFSVMFGELLGKQIASRTIQVVSGFFIVAIFDMFNSLDKAIDDNSFSKMLADQNAQQYLDFYTTHKTLLGEMHAGVLTADEVGAFLSSYDGFETSRYYQNGFTDLTSNAVSALSGVVNTDTGDRLCRDGKKIPDGELVCPEQKIDRGVFFEELRDNPVFAFSAAPFEIYRAKLFGVISLESIVHPAVKAVNGVIGQAFSFVMGVITSIPGLGDAFNAAISFVSDGFLKLAGTFIALFEPVLTGDEESGPVPFESTAAGADVYINQYMRDEMGAPRITTEQAQEIYMKAMDDRAARIANKSIWNRVFNFRDTDSLAFNVLGKTSIALSGQQSVAGAFSSLVRNVAIAPIGHALNALSFDRAYAAANQDVVFGAFGMPQYGYTLNCGEAGSESNPLCIDPEILTDEYCATLNQQWLDSKKYDPVTGIEYYEVANPCKADNVLNTVLGGMLSQAVDSTNSSSMGMDPSDVVVGNTEDVPCFAGTDLGPQVGHAAGVAYDIRICEVASPNGTGKVKVNSQISGIVNKMLNDSYSEGKDLIAGIWSLGGYRTYAEQASLYTPGSQDAAAPGYSRHEMGLAIDFPGIDRYATADSNQNYAWLEANASEYGFRVLSFEHWHWSLGSAYE